MCAESLEDLILFQTFYHLQSNNLCRFEQVLDIGLSCFHLIIILVLKVGQTPFTNIFLIGSNNQFQNYESGFPWITWQLSILPTSPNNQISEFQIPNIYNQIFVLIFFNDSENTFWGFFEI